MRPNKKSALGRKKRFHFCLIALWLSPSSFSRYQQFLRT